MSAHTPGPWIVVTGRYSTIIRKEFRTDHHMDICSAVHGYMYADDEKANQFANARLIAAAPELLEVVGRLMRVIEAGIPDLEDVDCYQMAKELLVKIDGGTA